MRKIVLTIHLTLGLILGLFVVATCTSGSLLLIESDVERWLHPLDHKVTPGETNLASIKLHTESAYPDYKIDSVEYPAKDKMYHVRLSKVTGKGTKTVFADPGTGEVFGQVQEARVEPFATIYQLHRYFLLLPVIGKTGAATVVGLIGVGLLLILITGVYLWWPGIRSWATGFKFVRNRGKLMQNMSLHKLVGMISVPVLLFATLTGVINAFEKQIPGWVGFKAKEEIPAAALQSKSKEGLTLPMERVIEIVKEKYPSSKIIKITLPTKAGQSYLVGVNEGIAASPGSNSTIYVDSYSGNVLYKTDPALAINLYNSWRKGLHFATWGGVATKLIAFVFGMMPLVLMITGLTIWRIKAKARKRSRKPATAGAVVA
ncbi:PepSY-associated TM helix domain-containing protein [Paenibacillus roseipurpureus]|uniref:PepSY-associated TM helix domain-containing protein n=1 Tax=Paenibacillus roseopurpureus TaxID=2918901 RepID=A0AA96LQR6_9BACL|nr:PepSY-associated TM helix domain-containing protein [Paenibacillus sp. MBLB1832]WNR45464.1 PepSY-associated TM helix domain-containing protein [Paenibacillus sp. MBLB1832]